MANPRETTRSLRATAQLLEQVRSGDDAAVRDLVELYRPLLERWASGRLPGHARGLVDTVDLVHVCLIRILERVDQFDTFQPGAFIAYARRALLNQIRNEIRAAASRPRVNSMQMPELADLGSIEEEVGSDTVATYEAALSQLPEDDQAAVILRIEFRLKYDDIAEALSRPSADAVRKQVTRSLVRLARLMTEASHTTP